MAITIGKQQIGGINQEIGTATDGGGNDGTVTVLWSAIG